jgi:hypothetical protein
MATKADQVRCRICRQEFDLGFVGSDLCYSCDDDLYEMGEPARRLFIRLAERLEEAERHVQRADQVAPESYVPRRRGPGRCDLCGHFGSQHDIWITESGPSPCRLIDCYCPNMTYEYEYTQAEMMKWE